MKKYYCDCCEKEVKNPEELHLIEILNKILYKYDGSKNYSVKEVCDECHTRYELECRNVFGNLKKEYINQK